MVAAPLMLMHPSAYATPQDTQTSYVSPMVPTQKGTDAKKEPIVQGIPKRIIVPRLSIDLPIVAGNYDAKSDSWTLSDDKAHYAVMTSKPNDQAGLTLIYGHNTWAVFAPLISLQPGDTVQVRTTNGHKFVYTFKKSTRVSPKTTSILSRQSSKPQLALMTCDGIWSEARRIMFFDLKEAS